MGGDRFDSCPRMKPGIVGAIPWSLSQKYEFVILNGVKDLGDGWRQIRFLPLG
jgi:hypothetical protein